MSICLYLYSYPKTAVKASVREAWDKGGIVSHMHDVFAEVENNADVLEWSSRVSFAYEALKRLTPKDENGHYYGDNQFSITKEQLIQLRNDILELDQNEEPLEDWAVRSLEGLLKLIDFFPFNEKYLTIMTD